MRALLLQYIQTRPCESRVRFPRPVRRLRQTPAKRKNLSARVISRDRSQAGRRGRECSFLPPSLSYPILSGARVCTSPTPMRELKLAIALCARAVFERVQARVYNRRNISLESSIRPCPNDNDAASAIGKFASPVGFDLTKESPRRSARLTIRHRRGA